jgi:hypothetical protein
MEISNKLLITIYLNQKIVFDMLATLEDGFSQLSEITRSEIDTKNKESNIGGSVGVSNVFAFLGINFNANKKSASIGENSETMVATKIHTPSSLFVKLYNKLEELNKINRISEFSDLQKIKTGDFVEFKGTLIKNPLISTFESFSKMMELVYSFSDSPIGKGMSKQSQGINKNEYQKIKKQIDLFTSALTVDNTFDIICEIDNNLTSVVNVYKNYFFNKNLNEIIDGEYTVIGKVVKISFAKDGNSINLLRNTGLNLAKKELMDKMFQGFKSSEMSSAGMDIPDFSTIIENDAMLVIPICIYT